MAASLDARPNRRSGSCARAGRSWSSRRGDCSLSGARGPMILRPNLALALSTALVLCLRTNAFALDCSELTPAQIEVLPPPGVCDPATHAALENQKDTACNPVRRCTPGETCSSIEA